MGNITENAVLESLRQVNREQSANEILEFITQKVIEQGVTSIEWIEDEKLREALQELDKVQSRLREPQKGSVIDVKG